MEPVIAITNRVTQQADEELSLRWSRRLSLTTRILAVNIFALALLAGSLFYLNNYRDRLTDERLAQARLQVEIISAALAGKDKSEITRQLPLFAEKLDARLRFYDANGSKLLDSFTLAQPGYELINPDTQPWRKDVARTMDRFVEFTVGSKPLEKFSEPEIDNADNWPELKNVNGKDVPVSTVQQAPDRTPVIIAAGIVPDDGNILLLTSNARDITRIVRAERAGVVIVIVIAAIISVLLSLFLARTIVKPIRKLARAAVRVRLGRAPEITIPTMPGRRDEIGQLARALSDMSGALRHRIDATEAFAADVSHEIKNPLASLRSALEGLESVKDPDLQKQLLTVASDDVRRIDRLINDISEASRVDAELARTKFERVDIGKMLDQLLAVRESRGNDRNVNIAYARPARGITTVMGDDGRLERVFTNLLDNAVSFSPENGLIEILATPDGGEVVILISDDGPGVPVDQKDKIFDRFHSDRPKEEAFGKHSGLGLAIAKTIVEGHEGVIALVDRPDGRSGACFEIRLPKADSVPPL